MGGVGIRGKDISWNDEWIIVNYWEYDSLTSLCLAYNELHNTNINRAVFSHHCCGIGLTREYNKEHDDFITNSYSNFGKITATDMFNEMFGQKRTIDSIEARAKKIGVKVTNERRKQAGSENSRIKFDADKYKLGAIRIHHGYTYIKVSDDISNHNRNWRLKHHVVYENNFGKIPKGYIVEFLDNDKTNFDPNNLVAIPWKYHGWLQGNLMKSSNPIVTQAGIMWCELQDKLTEYN